MSQEVSSQEQALEEAFQRFDVNRDGKIEAEEFHRLMNNIGGFSSNEIAKLFADADVDGSGSLDWREFIRWVCSGKATKDMTSSGAKSFSRLLQREAATEASFVEEAALSHAVQANLRESSVGKSQAEERQYRSRKQFQLRNAQRDAPSSTSGFVPPEEDYVGYRLPVPVTFEGATGLMQHYLEHGDKMPLHPTYVSYLTLEFTKAYKAKHPKPVVNVDTPSPGRLTIVGDTHGQLPDVLHILFQLGPPTRENIYLFNGDIADRGQQAVEIFMILFAFFLADNSSIIINRGNHENEDMNALDVDNGGGFSDEVMGKYNILTYRRFVGAFKVLSLAAVVQKEIFVVHGGLSRIKTLTVDYINSLPHHDYTAPPPTSNTLKEQVFLDLLWSDPTAEKGKFKSDRGIGIKYGPDITTKFCMQNRLRFMIRSHQVPSDSRGYAKEHDGRCVTVFSASNYCGQTGNYGAVLVLSSDHFPKYEIYEHYAASLEDLARTVESSGRKCIQKSSEPSMQTTRRDEDEQAASAARWDSEVSRMIVALIEKKPQIWAHVVNTSSCGMISVDVFQALMSKFIDEPHPWGDAAQHWGILSEDKTLDVAKFLGRWAVSLESEKYNAVILGAVKEIYAAIISRDMGLEQALRVFDTDGDGSVELKEFRQALGMFDLGLTGAQLDRLTGTIFRHMLQSTGPRTGTAGRIGVQEFLARFTLIYKQVGTEAPSRDIWVNEAIERIGVLILRTPESVLLGDFEKAATTIQKVARGSAARRDARNTEGRSSCFTRPSWMTSSKGSRPPSASGPHQQQRPPGAPGGLPNMCALYRAMDISGDGILTLQEFVSGLEKIPGIFELAIQGGPLTHARLLTLVEHIDTTRNGTINYFEFSKAFQISEDGAQDIEETLMEDFTTLLFRHRMSIRAGCLYFDDEGLGFVLAEEFKKVLESVNVGISKHERMLTSNQMELLVEALSDDGQVNYEALLKAFVIVDNSKNRAVVKRF